MCQSAKCPNQTPRMQCCLWKSFQPYRGPVASALLTFSFPDQVSKKARWKGGERMISGCKRAPDEEETCSILKILLTDPQAGLTALESFWFCFFFLGGGFGFLKGNAFFSVNTDLLLQEYSITKIFVIQVFANKMLRLFICEILHFFLTIKSFSLYSCVSFWLVHIKQFSRFPSDVTLNWPGGSCQNQWSSIVLSTVALLWLVSCV